MSFTTNTSNVTGKSTTNAFNIVADSITVNKNELVKGDLTVLGNTNIGNVTLETANVDYLTVNHFTATNPVPTTSGGTGLSTIGSAGQVLQVNLAGNGLTYGTAGLTNPSTITGTGFTGTPTYSMGIESTGTGTDGRGFVRTSSEAFGLDIQTSGTGKYIKLESDTVSIPQTTTPSTSTSTGALVVTGDVGIGGKVNLAGDLKSYSTTSQFVNVSDTINLGPFGFPVSYLTAAGRISMNGILSLPAPNPFTDNSQLAFQPATGSFVAFGYPSYNLTLSSGTASTTIGPSSSPTSFGISSAIQNTVYSFSNTLVAVPVPVPAIIENTTIGYQAGTAFGGFCKTYLRTDNLSGAQLIDINAQGGSGGIGTIGNVNIFASGGLVGSQIRIATLGANTAGVLINPGSGGVNLSPSAGGVTANPTAGGILLQAKDTSNINIQTGTAFYPSPSASGSVIISSASGSVSIDASQQLFTVGYIAALPGSTSVPVGSNLCGAIALIASNNSAAYATGNIDLYTTATGINTGPGNITLNTSNAYTGLMNFTSKGLITFEASSGADLVTIDPTNFQYRFHNSGGGHCLSIDRNAAIFTFPTSTPAPNTQGFIDVNVTNATSGCLLSMYASSMTVNTTVSKIFGKSADPGNSIQEIFTYETDNGWNNTFEMKFYNNAPFLSVSNGIVLPTILPVITLRSYQNLNINFGSNTISFNGTNLTSSYTWKWPATMGTNGQVLVTDGSSQVYWQNTSSLGYVTGVTASSPLASSGGSAPNISISTTPTFNSVTFAAQNLADKTISAGTSWGLTFAANGIGGGGSFRFCNSTGSTNYITVNEVYYTANINGVLGVTGISAKLEVVNPIAPIVAGNAINTGLFLTQNMNSTDQNVITIGKTQSANGNCGQIYYIYDSTLTNCKFGLKFYSSSTSPTIEMQNNNTVTITGNFIQLNGKASITNGCNVNSTNLSNTTALNPALYVYNNAGYQYGMDLAYGSGIGGGYSTRIFCPNSASIVMAGCPLSPTSQSDFTNYFILNGANGNTTINSSSSTFSTGSFNVTNSYSEGACIASFLSPNLTSGSAHYITFGKTVGVGGSANLYYSWNSTLSSATCGLGFYGTSTPDIQLTNNGQMTLSGMTNITSNVSGGNNTLYGNGSLNVVNNAIQTTGSDAYITIASFFAPLLTTPTSYITIPTILLGRDRTYNANIYYYEDKTTGYLYSAWTLSRAKNTDPYATSQGMIVLGGDETVRMFGATTITSSSTSSISILKLLTPSATTTSNSTSLLIGQADSSSRSAFLAYTYNASATSSTTTWGFNANNNAYITQVADGNINLSCSNTNITGSSVLYDSGVLNVVNTSSSSSATATFFAPNLSSGNTTIINFGKGGYVNGAAGIGFSYNSSSSITNTFWGFYGGSSPSIVMQNNGGDIICRGVWYYFNDSSGNAGATIKNGLGRNDTSFSGSAVITARSIQTTDVNYTRATDAGLGGTNGIFFSWQNYAGTNVGGIYTNNSVTIYSTSSDYRLKTNIQPLTNALDKITQLKPCTYTFTATNINSFGFLAHEAQEIIPETVRGEKDQVDENNNPIYQQIDYSKFVPYTVAAIQELYTEIQNLKTQIALLK